MFERFGMKVRILSKNVVPQEERILGMDGSETIPGSSGYMVGTGRGYIVMLRDMKVKVETHRGLPFMKPGGKVDPADEQEFIERVYDALGDRDLRKHGFTRAKRR